MVSDSEFIEAIKCSQTMSEAASKLGMHFNTFKRRAIKLGVYNPNQGSKGIERKRGNSGFSLSDILNGNHPQYQTNKLRNRLIREGIKEYKCEICGITEWLGNRLTLDLHHIDGNSTNHKLDNLMIICPNCHAQTETYKSKNIR